MDLETYKKAKIIQDDISEVKKKIHQLKDTLPQLIAGNKLILTYGELQDLGIIDSVVEALKNKITDLEKRFKNLQIWD